MPCVVDEASHGFVHKEGEDCRVNDRGAEFFHKVEHEGRLAVALGMIEAQVGVEPHVQAGALNFVVKDAIAIVESGVEFVAAAGPAAGEADQLFQRGEVAVGNHAFNAKELLAAFGVVDMGVACGLGMLH